MTEIYDYNQEPPNVVQVIVQAPISRFSEKKGREFKASWLWGSRVQGSGVQGSMDQGLGLGFNVQAERSGATTTTRTVRPLLSPGQMPKFSEE